MIVPDFPHKIETEIIQAKEIDITLIIDCETIQKKEQITTITTTDPVTTQVTKTTKTQIDRQTILSHHIVLTLNIQAHNKTTEVVHLGIKDKLTKYN